MKFQGFVKRAFPPIHHREQRAQRKKYLSKNRKGALLIS
jgi:hypothetical protein